MKSITAMYYTWLSVCPSVRLDDLGTVFNGAG